MMLTRIIPFVVSLALVSCSSKTESESSSEKQMEKIKLITLDPGHFHAALVQKPMYDNVDSVVHVYAPEGSEVQEHLKKIDAYNNRAENPTSWKIELYTGDDYLSKMLADKPGNVVVISGNNRLKTEYIKKSVDAIGRAHV